MEILRASVASLAVAAALVAQPAQQRHRQWRLGAIQKYTVTLDLPGGETATFPCAEDEFILDAAEEAGFDLPSSCRSGACTSCQGRVLSGNVWMDDQSVLEEEHIAAGYVCTCIACPESDVRVVTHQMENFEEGVME